MWPGCRKLFLLCSLLLLTGNVLAWKQDGHELVCRLAFAQLDEQARKNLTDLLGELDAKQACNWARERQAVMLLYAFEWSMSEVAELLGVSKSAVQSYAYRGLDKLRTGLGVTT